MVPCDVRRPTTFPLLVRIFSASVLSMMRTPLSFSRDSKAVTRFDEPPFTTGRPNVCMLMAMTGSITPPVA